MNMKNIKNLLKFEGLILVVLGVVHVLYLLLFVEFVPTVAPFYIGASIYGVIYTFLGIGLMVNKRTLLLPALVLNGIGLLAALITHNSSIYGDVNWGFIILDLVSVPLLVYLNWANHKERESSDPSRITITYI
jgi:uncharacterized membrane protein